MTRILFLDDDAERHASFAREFAKDERTHVETFDDFERALYTQPRFDIIYLDHDLNDFGSRSVMDQGGYGGWCGSAELTGTDAAVLVTRLPPEKQPDRVVVHSWNVPGAERMMNILRDAGVSARRQMFRPFK